MKTSFIIIIIVVVIIVIRLSRLLIVLKPAITLTLN